MDFTYVLNNFVNQLAPIFICVVLPVSLARLYYRNRKHHTDKQAEIVMKAIENNSDLDVREFMKALTPVRKPLRERLIERTHWEILLGSSLTLGSAVIMVFCLATFIYSAVIDSIKDGCLVGIFACSPFLALGVGLLCAYRRDKKVLETLND